MEKVKKILLPEDVELEKLTIEVFKQKDIPRNTAFTYFLKEEKARETLATHIKCIGCGEIKRNRGYCESCSDKQQKERYIKKPFLEWDRVTPVVIYNSDQYFFDVESIDEYLEENELLAENLELIICSPNHFGEVSEDYWEDIIPENWDSIEEGNKAVAEKLKEFNAFLQAQPPFSWSEGVYRTSYSKKL